MTRVPMNTPLVSLRITAYHRVLASRSPRTGCHGSAGGFVGTARPRSINCSRVAI